MDKTVLISMTIEELQSVIINCVNTCLKYDKVEESNTDSDQVLNIEQTAEILDLKVPTIYGLVSRSAIPCFKKGKRLYFSKKDLSNWISSGRKKTLEELDSEAEKIIKGK